jgi:hypothetical protein
MNKLLSAARGREIRLTRPCPHHNTRSVHAVVSTAYPVPPLPGVTPLTIEIREVYASA